MKCIRCSHNGCGEHIQSNEVCIMFFLDVDRPDGAAVGEALDLVGCDGLHDLVLPCNRIDFGELG